MRSADLRLLPVELVERGKRLTRDAFAVEYGDTALLLIRLDGTDTELALGLVQASTANADPIKPNWEPMGYATVVGRISDIPEPLSQRSGPRAFNEFSVQKLFLSAPHFIAPLRKRPIAGKPFSSRISVGRALNNDIVLRNESVSKFHAYFEFDEDGQLALGEGRSTNPTLLNGLPVGREVQLVSPGDVIRFGSVDATVCSAVIFWDALHDSA